MHHLDLFHGLRNMRRRLTATATAVVMGIIELEVTEQWDHNDICIRPNQIKDW